MIGIIVSGHGLFGTGLEASLHLIAGEKQNVKFVDFLPEDSQDSLKEKMLKAMNEMPECTDILCLADLVSGTPFQTFVGLKYEVTDKHLEVVCGANLAILIETSMAKDFIEDLNMLADMAISTGKDSIQKFEMAATTNNNDDLEGDGI